MRKAIGYKVALTLLFFLIFFAVPVHGVSFEVKFCPGGTSIQTAIGCLDTTPQGFFKKLFEISLGIAGGVAMLMILLGGLQIQTSAGNPKRLEMGREIIEGAIIGLLLIIFSIFILKVIGVDIFGIPGFTP